MGTARVICSNYKFKVVANCSGVLLIGIPGNCNCFQKESQLLATQRWQEGFFFL